jgi:hypothetical protein
VILLLGEKAEASRFFRSSEVGGLTKRRRHMSEPDKNAAIRGDRGNFFIKNQIETYCLLKINRSQRRKKSHDWFQNQWAESIRMLANS